MHKTNVYYSRAYRHGQWLCVFCHRKPMLKNGEYMCICEPKKVCINNKENEIPQIISKPA